MIDPISTGIVAGAAITLALIFKAWARESGAMRIELAKIGAQRNEDRLGDLIEDAEEARKMAQRASETAERFESRLSAVENRARR